MGWVPHGTQFTVTTRMIQYGDGQRCEPFQCFTDCEGEKLLCWQILKLYVRTRQKYQEVGKWVSRNLWNKCVCVCRRHQVDSSCQKKKKKNPRVRFQLDGEILATKSAAMFNSRTAWSMLVVAEFSRGGVWGFTTSGGFFDRHLKRRFFKSDVGKFRRGFRNVTNNSVLTYSDKAQLVKRKGGRTSSGESCQLRPGCILLVVSIYIVHLFSWHLVSVTRRRCQYLRLIVSAIPGFHFGNSVDLHQLHRFVSLYGGGG